MHTPNPNALKIHLFFLTTLLLVAVIFVFRTSHVVQAVAPFSFASPINYPVGTAPSKIVIADFNQDSKLDLATINSSSQNISILLNNGTGSFNSAVNFSLTAAPVALGVGDFNGDSKLDLVVASSGKISLLLGDGSGGFGSSNSFPSGNSTALTVADLNNDGWLDVATTNDNDTVSVLLNNGSGSLGSATSFNVGSSPNNIKSGDFNNDGKLDLVTTNFGSNNLTILLGNGIGGFNLGNNFAVGSGPTDLAKGDFNNDGRLDVIVANSLSSNVSLLPGNGTGSFGPAINFGSTSQTAVIADDFNGDGKLDFAAANAGSNYLYVRLGDGASNFSSPYNFSLSNLQVFTVGSGDFNADNLPDLVTVNRANNNVSILINNSTRPTAQIVTVFGSPQNTAVNTNFTTPLQARVSDLNNNPLEGVMVTFSAPFFGATGTFPNNEQVLSVATDATGLATAPAFKANCTPGNFSVKADTTGVGLTANFQLTSKVGAPSSFSLVAGSAQAAPVATNFGNLFQVKVLDGCGNPVAGQPIRFSAPESGASGVFGSLKSVEVATASNGIATAPGFTANTIAGSYSVSASVVGYEALAAVNFNLINVPGSPAILEALAGTPQSAPDKADFSQPFKARLKDSYSNTIPNVTVTFSAPDSGASGIFSNTNSLNASAKTDLNGVATAPTFTANCQLGNYNVKASVTGLAQQAYFLLTNRPNQPVTLTANTGPKQRTLISTTFQSPLQVLLKDWCDQPVDGITAVFSSPNQNGQPGGFFAGPASVTSDSKGLATAPAFTANGTTGQYTVTVAIPAFPALGNVSFEMVNLSADYGAYLASTIQLNPSHDGALLQPKSALPLQQKWSISLGRAISYPVVGQHKAFITVLKTSSPGSDLYAIDLTSGQIAWGPVDLPSSYNYAGLAYEDGKVFITSFDRSPRAFDASSGALLWSSDQVGGSNTPPTPRNGIVYLGANSAIYALREADGTVMWSKPLQTSDDSSPTVTDDGLYVGYSCLESYKLQPFNGTQLWYYLTGCRGGGGKTTVFYNNKVYGRGLWSDNIIFDSQTGKPTGTFPSGSWQNFTPAFYNGIGFFSHEGILEARDLATNAQLWSLNKGFITAPLVINGNVFVGTSSGNLFSYAGNSGTQLWQGSAGNTIGVSGENDPNLITGLGAGEGFLLVPATNKLVAFEFTKVNQCNQPYVVTQATDDGTPEVCGSLTNAIATALTSNQPATITFSPQISVVTVNSQLPELSSLNNLTIDGGCTTDLSTGRGLPGVQIVAGNAAARAFRLVNNVTLRGLKIANFNGFAITITGSNNQLKCNWLGTVSGNTALANGGGVHFASSGATNNQLGDEIDPTTGNLISGNAGPGVLAESGNGNRLYYNWVGKQANGSSLLANTGGGLRVTSGTHLIIGRGNRF